MISLSSGDANNNFADALHRVAFHSEHIAIQGDGEEPVYLIPAKDYELFQKLLQQLEDKIDLQEAENRMEDAQQERVNFDNFFAELELEASGGDKKVEA